MEKNIRISAAILGLGRWGRNLVDSTLSDSKNKLYFTHVMTRTTSMAIDYCDRNILFFYVCQWAVSKRSTPSSPKGGGGAGGGGAPLLLWAEEVEPWLTTQWQTEK